MPKIGVKYTGKNHKFLSRKNIPKKTKKNKKNVLVIYVKIY